MCFCQDREAQQGEVQGVEAGPGAARAPQRGPHPRDGDRGPLPLRRHAHGLRHRRRGARGRGHLQEAAAGQPEAGVRGRGGPQRRAAPPPAEHARARPPEDGGEAAEGAGAEVAGPGGGPGSGPAQADALLLQNLQGNIYSGDNNQIS